MNKNRLNHIAYRCPECATATVGLVGGVESLGDLLRLKCECGGSILDIKKERDGRIHVSVPCIFCKDNHGYRLSPELDRTADELSRIMASLEADEVKDIQPHDVDEADCPPDPAIYDTINFVVRDLESIGAVKCPCDNGRYGLRFTDTGMQVYCESCGASYNFHCLSPSVAEEYLSLDEIILR